MLVGILFVLIYTGFSAGQPYLDGSKKQIDYMDSNYKVLQHQKNSDLGKLKLSGDTVYFPWASRYVSGVSPPPLASRSLTEKILLDGSDSAARVDQILANSLDISIKGAGDNAGDEQHEDILEDRNVQQLSGGHRAKSGGNYLNVEVSGITVNAINTVEGGSAVATSNIIIEPVQTIILAPEVEAKLK